MLNVDLMLLVARKRGVEPSQEAAPVPQGQLVLEQEIGLAPRVAEEQPVPPARAQRLAFLQKSAERRDPGAWPDHDDRSVRRGEAHAGGGMKINRNRRALGNPVAQKGRGDAGTPPRPLLV